MMSHHLAMFGGHWFNAKGDMKHLICHVTSKNHVIGRSSNFMSGTSSWYVTTLPSLVVIGVVIVKVFLNCHLIKQEHRINFMVCHHLAKFGGHRCCNGRGVFNLSCDQARTHD